MRLFIDQGSKQRQIVVMAKQIDNLRNLDPLCMHCRRPQTLQQVQIKTVVLAAFAQLMKQMCIGGVRAGLPRRCSSLQCLAPTLGDAPGALFAAILKGDTGERVQCPAAG
jgi:hypothetical protein